MHHRIKIALLSLVVVATAGANDGSKATTITFHASVEAPGIVLPAGDYTFRVAADESSGNRVEIFKENDDEPLTTLTTVPAVRSSVTEDAALLLEQDPGGGPEAIRELFYPGEKDGFEFVYSAEAVQADGNTSEESGIVEEEFVQFMRDQPLHVVVLPLPADEAARASSNPK